MPVEPQEAQISTQTRGQTYLSARERFRDRTILLRAERILLKGRIVDSRYRRFCFEIDLGYRECVADFFKFDFRGGVDASRRQALTRELRGECHRETACVSGANQLFRIGR